MPSYIEVLKANRSRLDQLRENELEQAKINEQTKKGQLGESLVRALPAAAIGAATGGLGAALLPQIGLGAVSAGVMPTAFSSGLAAGKKAFEDTEADPGKVGLSAGLSGIEQDVTRGTEKKLADTLGMVPSSMSSGKIDYKLPAIKKPTKGVVKYGGSMPTTPAGKGMQWIVTGQSGDGGTIWGQSKVPGVGKTSSSSSSTKDNLSNYTPEELKRAKMNALASGMSWNRLKENEKLSFAKDARNNPAPTIVPTATPENKDPAGLGI